MPTDDPKQNCGATTRRGGPCRNPALQGGRCRLHGGSLVPGASSDPDPAVRLRILQDAAERRALEAHHAGEGQSADKADAAFNRNARLVATLARVRLALTKARAEASGDGAGEGGNSELVIYRLPDNGR